MLLIHHLNQASYSVEQRTVVINRNRAACNRVRAARCLEGVDIFLAVVGKGAGAGERLSLDLGKVGLAVAGGQTPTLKP